MSENNSFDHRGLEALVEARGQRILKNFRKAAIFGVKEPKLLAILADVNNYWTSSKSSSRDIIRPILTSFCCEAVGGAHEAADDASLMFSLASSGFGIHDDILDRSSFKHLRQTILGLYGIDHALLVGDLLIVKAWALLHEAIKDNDSPMKMTEIATEYGKASVEICEAEFMETLCRRKLTPDLKYRLNILWKAMAEIAVCCKIGAILGNGKAREVEALAEFGRRLGFTFRLVDEIKDCLNIEGDLAHRIEYESLPLPLLFAAKCSEDAYQKIKIIVEKRSISPSDMKKLLELCFKTEAFDYIQKIARKNMVKAASLLHSLKPSIAQEVLSFLNERSYNRISELCI